MLQSQSPARWKPDWGRGDGVECLSGLFESIELLVRDETLKRLRAAAALA